LSEEAAAMHPLIVDEIFVFALAILAGGLWVALYL
jgi:hypothetical protein